MLERVASGEDRSRLPTVSLGGVRAHELETALGTVITFRRGRLEFTVAGSVTKATAEAAARGL